MLGLQHRLVFAVVAHRLARFLDGRGESRRGHVQARPEGVEQLVRRHHPLAALDQVGEQVEGLRLNGDPPALALEGPRFGVELVLAECNTHGRRDSISPAGDCATPPPAGVRTGPRKSQEKTEKRPRTG